MWTRYATFGEEEDFFYKRTAMFAAMTFLELNGYRFIAKQKEVVQFVLQVENEKTSVEEIAEWLEPHTKKIRH